MFIPDVQQQVAKEIIKARDIDLKSRNASNQLRLAHTVLFNSVWDESQITVQQLCDVLQNNAYKLFLFSKSTQEFLALILPNYLHMPMPSNREATVNPDGTVSIKMKKLVNGVVEWVSQSGLTAADLKIIDQEVKEFEQV